jgi:hypothetical protein
MQLRVIFGAILLGAVGAWGIVHSLRSERAPISVETTARVADEEPAAPARSVERRLPSAIAFTPTAALSRSAAEAPRGPRDEREQWIQRLAASGAAQTARTVDANNAFVDLALKLEQTHEGGFSTARCFAGGCYADATFTDRESFARFRQRIFEHGAPWPGQGFMSGPEELPDGRIQNTWVFLTQ